MKNAELESAGELASGATTAMEHYRRWQNAINAFYAASQVVIAWLHDMTSVTLRPGSITGDGTVVAGGWVSLPASFGIVPPSKFCRPSIRDFFEDGSPA